VSLVPLVGDFVKEFGFIEYPGPEQFKAGKGIKFANGVFSAFGEETNVALEMFDDGLVADSRHSTDLCDLFIEKVLGWIGGRLGVNHRNIPIREKTYRSELVVGVKFSIADAVEPVQKVSQALSQYFDGPQELTGLYFGSQQNHQVFTFERRVGGRFDQNQFYSAATIQTAAHIKALNSLEAILAGE
jgi:hypothetical protein